MTGVWDPETADITTAAYIAYGGECCYVCVTQIPSGTGVRPLIVFLRRRSYTFVVCSEGCVDAGVVKAVFTLEGGRRDG